MTKSNICEILSVFVEGRRRLVSDFCSEEPVLYHPMFAYEANSANMELAVDKYFFEWLNSHGEIYNKLRNADADADSRDTQREDDLNAFLLSYRKLCERFLMDKSQVSDEISHSLDTLVNVSIQYIDELLAMSGKSDVRLRKLCYQHNKSKYLFEREFTLLKDN